MARIPDRLVEMWIAAGTEGTDGPDRHRLTNGSSLLTECHPAERPGRAAGDQAEPLLPGRWIPGGQAGGHPPGLRHGAAAAAGGARAPGPGAANRDGHLITVVVLHLRPGHRLRPGTPPPPGPVEHVPLPPDGADLTRRGPSALPASPGPGTAPLPVPPGGERAGDGEPHLAEEWYLCPCTPGLHPGAFPAGCLRLWQPPVLGHAPRASAPATALPARRPAYGAPQALRGTRPARAGPEPAARIRQSDRPAAELHRALETFVEQRRHFGDRADTARRALAAARKARARPGPGAPVRAERGRSAGSGVTIRLMEPEDVAFVVREHLRHFPEGFFARLGPGFLTTYCRTYLTSPHARGYVAHSDGRRAGFLVGVLQPAAHRGHVLHAHGPQLAARAVAALLLRPALALHFLRTRLVRYGRKLLPDVRAGQAPPAEAGTSAVLSHVAVTGQARSRGIGSALIAEFVAAAENSGCACVSLVTTAGASGAGEYYERLGWLYRGENRTADGRTLATYDLPLRRTAGRYPRGPG
ncbi:GNAT family N-acetyltransferase [Streptomyces sp. ACA25]|uniref:GNAT family N-acetyltransferase n=1 Tax=Streptomyces sp. ACA25 TaxID=3022596 RepID=UPI0023082AF3|nr:GNAT family N-acetyltransferase [Streptomyces sp. ACA25]MDB1086437.1 GNAT family N-acetyltransferase [Streptomyces sp. ACA25]